MEQIEQYLRTKITLLGWYLSSMSATTKRGIIIIASFLAIVVVFIIIEKVVLSRYKKKIITKQKLIRETIYHSDFISANEFEANWIVSSGRKRSGFAGYKYGDTPGCYIILIFSHPVLDGNYSNYDDVYIGQSVNVCQRVHNHLNGKGNGDVYADLRNGKYVYVQFQRCERYEMNDLEKRLIAAFDATSSYNNTKGGGKVQM